MKKLNVKNINFVVLIVISLFSCKTMENKAVQEAEKKAIGTLEVVAEMDINPGNVAVSKEGRVFATIHPLRPSNLQLVEITGKNTYVPFPMHRHSLL